MNKPFKRNNVSRYDSAPEYENPHSAPKSSANSRIGAHAKIRTQTKQHQAENQQVEFQIGSTRQIKQGLRQPRDDPNPKPKHTPVI